MKYQKFILPLAYIATTILAAVANEDYAVGAAVVSNDQTKTGHDKSTNKLGVKPLEEEDNHPTPDHMKQPLDPYQKSATAAEDNIAAEVPEAKNYDAFIMSVSMIVVSEIGDKTFLIAALMAMRNSRVIVFTAAFTSLVVMTVLSGIVGHALPTLISQRVTQFLAAVLFVVFGAKLLREGLSMSKDLGVEEELAEVEEEIASSKINTQLDDMEGGAGSAQSTKRSWLDEVTQQLQNLASFIFTPIWIQVFVMTFLGEWGDRSQIATIAMAAGSEYWYVIFGAIIGHGLCTAAACLGGKLLAKKISMRNVTLGGAIAFFVFSILYFYDAYYNVES
ncbi:GDT1 [Candida margitis]|uniref:GDT1 n=1 Tax=Candida margitis TaxID=1775924 RepID=UPI0022277F51|nr:GDT1 [Candida margitis]KAI5969370.1 GDT1 [Candida margitis]